MRGYNIMIGPSVLEWIISVIIVAVVVFIVAKYFYEGKNTNENLKSGRTERNMKCSSGTVKIFDVPDKTAAMLMAIVADRLNVPLGELKFISIKEVKQEENKNEIQSNS